MSARRNVTTGLVVAAILGGSGYMAYTLAFPEQYDAPLPTRVWTVPTAPSAEASGPGTSTDGRNGTDYGPDDPRLNEEPTVDEARAEQASRGDRGTYVASHPDKPILDIPSLDIWAPLVRGTTSKTSMDLPHSIYVAAVSTRGASLDATTGSTVISGHVGAGPIPGALHPLSQIAPSAELVTRSGKGTVLHWRVVKTDLVDEDKVSDALFSPAGPRQLVVITCAGKWHEHNGRRSYEKRFIVTAVRA